jgi:hypothetical protein
MGIRGAATIPAAFSPCSAALVKTVRDMDKAVGLGYGVAALGGGAQCAD